MKVTEIWEMNPKSKKELANVLNLSNDFRYRDDAQENELSERNAMTLALLGDKLVESGILSMEDVVECFGFSRDYFIKEE